MSETLFKIEQKMDRADISNYLREIADKLEQGSIELKSNGQSVTLQPADSAELEIKAEREADKDETSLEIEIEWSDTENGSLEIG